VCKQHEAAANQDCIRIATTASPAAGCAAIYSECGLVWLDAVTLTQWASAWLTCEAGTGHGAPFRPSSWQDSLFQNGDDCFTLKVSARVLSVLWYSGCFDLKAEICVLNVYILSGEG
jgi:hypothetical protein